MLRPISMFPVAAVSIKLPPALPVCYTYEWFQISWQFAMREIAEK